MVSTPHTFLIGGKQASSTATLTVRNPYSGEPVGSVFLAQADHARKAIDACRTSFATTRTLSSDERAGILHALAEMVSRHEDELATLITEETGKPIKASHVEVRRAVMTFTVAAEESTRIFGETLPLDLNEASRGRFGIVRRFPIGPVLAITPFNFPLNLVAHKLAPAMAAGNPWILKPAPQAPLTALRLAAMVLEAGFPAAAVNVLPWENQVAELLVADEGLNMLTFTGSASVGWMLKSRAGRKNVVLELGGNAALIIDEGTDIESVVRSNAAAAFIYSGQVCIRTQRIYVHESIYEEYRDRFVSEVSLLKVGDPADETVTIGPMIDENAALRVESWIAEAKRAGVSVLVGGGRNGRVVEPTVLEHATPSMKVFCEEVFGPVVTLHRFERFEDAIDSVNNSRFGLQAGVFSNTMSHILQAFERLEVGGVILNDNPTYRMDSMPYGGIKESGFGREGIRYAIESMTEPKLLVVRSHMY